MGVLSTGSSPVCRACQGWPVFLEEAGTCSGPAITHRWHGSCNLLREAWLGEQPIVGKTIAIDPASGVKAGWPVTVAGTRVVVGPDGAGLYVDITRRRPDKTTITALAPDGTVRPGWPVSAARAQGQPSPSGPRGPSTRGGGSCDERRRRASACTRPSRRSTRRSGPMGKRSPGWPRPCRRAHRHRPPSGRSRYPLLRHRAGGRVCARPRRADQERLAGPRSRERRVVRCACERAIPRARTAGSS